MAGVVIAFPGVARAGDAARLALATRGNPGALVAAYTARRLAEDLAAGLPGDARGLRDLAARARTLAAELDGLACGAGEDA